ncbi:MAG: T9SS type A sorting domain-containing protein, partial [Bacteroidales bacterium]|nr:T9SS type A sorting domain-containing protein [Bacteroidales bacterium]
NPGNLGAVLTSSANLGSTNIKRGHAEQTSTDPIYAGFKSILRYYDITPTNNTGLNATLHFIYFDNELNGQTEENFSLYRSTNTGSTWLWMGASATDYTSDYVEQTSLTRFSRWTLSNEVSNPLPIELLSFQGVYENKKVNLYWSTAAEINNDYFTIERSVDSKNFEIITTVKGAGNSNRILKYSAIDESPPLGIVYYRLKQTDFDGTYKYSDVISVKVNGNVPGMNVSQPYSNGKIKATINNISGTDLFVEVYNVLGAVYFSEVYKPENNNFDLNVKTDNLTKGAVYFLRVSDSKESIVRKFVY